MKVSGQESEVIERAARRGLMFCAVVFTTPICLALLVLGWAMRDHDALHAAARTGDVARVEKLLDRHPDRLERRNKLGQTALHVAVWEGNTDVVVTLIKRGADVRATGGPVRSGDGRWTAMHIAASAGRVPVALELIRAGCDVNALSQAGETPLDVALGRGNAALARALQANGGVSAKSQ